MRHKIIIILGLFMAFTSHSQIIVNEVIFETNEVEFKNVGSSTINIIGTFIQSSGNSMWITDATNLMCGDYNLSPDEKVVVPISYTLSGSGGDLFIYQSGQIPTAYVQWGGVQGFATLAFAEGLWDDPMEFIPGVNQDEVIILVDDADRKNPDGWLSIGEASPCDDNDQCEFTAASVFDILCDDNGTSDDPTDDFITFHLKVIGNNLPSELKLSSTSGSLDPTVMLEYQFSDLYITSYSTSSNGVFDLTISAGAGLCEHTLTFDVPNSCSPDCNMDFSQVILLGCVDNGTDDDPSDDFIELVAKPFGFNLAQEYYVEFSFGNVLGPFVNMEPFSVISTQGFYTPGDGNFSVTIIDGDNPECTETIDVINQESCSPFCTVDIDSLAVHCDDGGTLYDDSDDFYTLDLQVSSTVSASNMFQASINPFLAIPEMLDYNVLHSFSSAPGNTNAINSYSMTVFDPAYPDCIGLTLHGFLDEGCLTECEIFPADIALSEAPLICLEPEDESEFTFDIINGIVMDSFLLVAIDEFDDIVFFTDKLTFDARELQAGEYQFLVVHFFELEDIQIGWDLDRLEGCFALSPMVDVEIRFEENCSTSSSEVLNDFSIHPNPVHDILCIESEQPYKRLVLHDVNGSIVFSKEYINCLDLTEVRSGTYLLELRGDKNVNSIYKRLVKL